MELLPAHIKDKAEPHSRNCKVHTDNPMETLEKEGEHHNVIQNGVLDYFNMDFSTVERPLDDSSQTH